LANPQARAAQENGDGDLQNFNLVEHIRFQSGRQDPKVKLQYTSSEFLCMQKLRASD
jgi:hypothetical protein